MFLPLVSDSALRYWPFVTAGLIVVNIVCFFIQHQVPDPLYFTLSHGDGLHPIQWFTSFFMHAGIGHLIGNMIFLWVFGHIVEGVVGHGLFAALYLGMGVVQNAVEQTLFLGAGPSFSLGASGAIYSIMLLAAWFCPQDNVKCFAFIFYRPYFFEVPVLMMVLFYFLFDIAHASYTGFEMSTPLLHAAGGLVGLVVGFVLLQTHIVENDNKDALSMFHDARGKPRPKVKSKRQVEEEASAKEAARLKLLQQLEVAEKSFLMHLKAGNLEATLNQYRRLKQLNPKFDWQEDQLLKVITLAQNAKNWQQAISLCQTYLEHFDVKQVPVRLHLANMLLHQETAPIRAIKVLRPIMNQSLSPDHKKLFNKLVAECKFQIEDGSLEVRDE